jgi:hypothetical protein
MSAPKSPRDVSLSERLLRQPWWWFGLSRKTVIVLLPVALWPWLTLGHVKPQYGAIVHALIVVQILWPIVWIGILLRADRYVMAAPALVVAALVIEQAIFVEGTFAQIYHTTCAHNPHSFDQSSPMSAIDAAYFTISVATTTGLGDIHPASGAARLVVSAQMIASVYLVVIAIGTAVGRIFAPDAHDDQQQHQPGDEPPNNGNGQPSN